MSIKISGFSSTGGGGGGLPQYGAVPAYYNIGNGIEEGNNNPAQVGFSSPGWGTTLFFVASDRGANDNNDGYISYSGASEINAAINGGAQYWEYVWASYLQTQNPDGDSGIVATNAPILGRWIAISETLRSADGATCPSYLANYATTTSNNTVALTNNVTMNNGEFVVIAAGVEKGGGAITSITTNSGLTWNRRSSKSHIPSSNNTVSDHQTLEIWYAVNDTGSDITEQININYSSQFDDQAVVITTWSNVDPVTPWAN